MSTSSLFPAILGNLGLSSLDYWLPFIGIAGGYLFGAILTWLLLRNRLITTRTRLEERLRASEKNVADLEAGAARLEHEVAQIRKAESVALKQQGLLEGSMNSEREKAEEKIHLLNKAEEQMLDSFRLISRESIAEGQGQFVTMAAKVFEGQLATWRNDCEEQLKPLGATLVDIQDRLIALEQSREGATRILHEQIARAVETEEDRQASPFSPGSEPSPPSSPTVPKVQAGGSSKKKPDPIPAANPRDPDPRPYAASDIPVLVPVPEAKPKKKRSTPATFMEDLDDTPLGARPESRPITPVAPVVPIPPAKPPEPDQSVPRRDVLDDDLEGKFEGFESKAESNGDQPADPKRAADDLRAALES